MSDRFGAGNRHGILLLLFILCWSMISAIVVCAQTREQMDRYEESYFPGTLFRNQESDTASAFTGKCPEFASRACNYDTEVTQECQVVGVSPLGTAGGRQFFLARYRRTVVVHEESTCETDEALVLESLDEQRSQPVWYDATERKFTFLKDVSLVHSEKHSFLIVEYCVNGTGGCWQSAYLWAQDQWKMLKHDETWDDVYSNMPDGYWTHKSPPIDFHKLRWEQNIATKGDANCCPSGKILWKLQIVNDELSVENHEFVVEGNP